MISDVIHFALSGELQMETQLSDRVDYSSKVLTLCLVARIYGLKKFARFHKVQKRNLCKVDHKALCYVKVLSETQQLGMQEQSEMPTCRNITIMFRN